MAKAGAVRIIIKRPVQAAGHHGGGWKIAFADFMTAMMAFFLVMWLLAIASPQQLVGIAEHFKTPLKVAISGGPSASLSSSVIPGGGPDPMHKAGEVQGSDAQATAQDDAYRMEQLRELLDQLIESSPVLKLYKPQLLIDITPEGLRIQIVDNERRPMFDRSSAVVVPSMRSVLRELAPLLNQQPNKLTISGHTDAVPYAMGDKGYSNWELSADRANASRRELVAGGLAEGKVLRVIGVAASIHLDAENPMADANRRMSIVVLNQRAQAQIEAARQVKPAYPLLNPTR
jgi:chemotaxis protein MotB